MAQCILFSLPLLCAIPVVVLYTTVGHLNSCHYPADTGIGSCGSSSRDHKLFYPHQARAIQLRSSTGIATQLTCRLETPITPTRAREVAATILAGLLQPQVYLRQFLSVSNILLRECGFNPLSFQLLPSPAKSSPILRTTRASSSVKPGVPIATYMIASSLTPGLRTGNFGEPANGSLSG